MSQAAKLSEQERLIQAKELIEQKRYIEAQKLLQPIARNPVAQKWLQKLATVSTQVPQALRTPAPKQQDEFYFPPNAARQTAAIPTAKQTATNELPTFNNLPQSLPNGEPWDPMSMAMFAPTFRARSYGFGIAGLVFFTVVSFVLGFGLKLAGNWQRFGKSKWALWGSILNILFSLVGIAAVVIIIFSLLTDHLYFGKLVGSLSFSQSTMLVLGVLGGLSGLNLALLVMQLYLQKDAYGYWQRTHNAAGLLNYPYNFDNGCLLATVIVAVFVVAGVAFALYDTQPRNYATPYFTVQTESYWDQSSGDDAELCQESGGCMLTLKKGALAFDEVYIFFTKAPNNGFTSADALRESAWRETTAPNSEFRGINHYPIKLDGRSAGAIEYTYSDLFGTETYAMVIYVIMGREVLEIHIQSVTKSAFDNNREYFTQVLQKIDLKEI